MDTYNSVSTPKTKENLLSSKDATDISSRITPFGQRISKFTSQFVFNSESVENRLSGQELNDMEDDIIRRVQTTERCNLQVHHLQPQSGCRFMYDRTKDRVISTTRTNFMFLFVFPVYTVLNHGYCASV